MASGEKVRIGFVGVGGMGQCAHLRNYALIKECEVVAIAEVRPKLARKVAARYGVPKVYPDHKAMLAEEDLDGIVASQPFERHGILVPELLAANIPVFTEKPLSGSVEYGERIVAAEAESAAWLMVGYHKRSDPAIMYAKKEIDRLKENGALGALKYVRLLMPAGDWMAGGFSGLITTDEPVPTLESEAPAKDIDAATFADYTTFVNYYIHQVNLLRHLLGEPYRVTFADKAGILLVAESESGLTGTIEMSPYCTTIDWQEEALMAFEKGYVKVTLPAPVAVNRPGHVEILRDPGEGTTPETLVPQLPWVHAMHQQARNFIAAIHGECAPLCGAPEALEDLKVAQDYIRIHRGN